MKKLGRETRAVHSGREDLAELGVHAPPIDLSTTYPVGSMGGIGECFDALAQGGPLRDNPIYARLHNPTVVRFEKALATLARRHVPRQAAGLAPGGVPHVVPGTARV